jgi:asparagine synthase (glutamine-hydrolysing)
MCGLFGFFGARATAESLPLTDVLDSLAHRGPDGRGSILLAPLRPEDEDRRCLLGHTRLRILDLTDAAHQPMRTEDGRHVLAYNGEVFNFAALREELRGLGQRFRSTGDTEVVLKALVAWGAGALDRFRGMFALAFWDAERGRLLLARDRLGIKPLYLVERPDGVAFASEVRALLRSGLVPRELSPAALRAYLRAGAVGEPETLVAGLEALGAGETAEVDARGEVHRRRYWDLPAAAEEKVAFPAAVERIRPRLREAVGLRLVADVPLGVFLSGGVDSSVLTGLAAEQHRGPVHTFTVTFDEPSFSEETFAAEVAARFGCDHHQVHLGAPAAAAEFERVLDALDQPSADGVNTYFVAKAAREAGLTVALSGMGADELFAGYPAFARFGTLCRAARLARPLPAGLIDSLEGPAGRLWGDARPSRLADLLRGRGLPAFTYRSVRSLFTDRQVAALVAPVLRSPVAEAGASAAALNGHDPVNVFSRLELRNYLRNTLLRDTDAMSMRHSLEVRVPFLDHLLVEDVLSLPGSVKLGRHGPKPLLVAAGPPLPQDVVSRPKMGFVLPLDVWLRGPLAGRTREVLHAGGGSLLEEVAVEALWQGFLLRRPLATASRLWALVALQGWVQRHRLSVPA